VYLVVIGWLYVVLMMAVAEASNTTGTLLGAIVTFFLYGLAPVALVVYLMQTPQRRKAFRAREAADDMARQQAGVVQDGSSEAAAPSDAPDTGGHAAGTAQTDRVAAMGKEH
jgi:hypothetical protein